MKSPAAAGANLCYIVCGGAIVALPYLGGYHIPDVFMLLAVNMIFLGLASFVFHSDGEVLNDWSHRADLTFILVVIGAMPSLAMNALWQAYNGKKSPPRDLVAMLTKMSAMFISGCVRWPASLPSLSHHHLAPDDKRLHDALARLGHGD